MLGVKRPNVCLIGYRARLGRRSRACHAMDYVSGAGSVHDTPANFGQRSAQVPLLNVTSAADAPTRTPPGTTLTERTARCRGRPVTGTTNRN